MSENKKKKAKASPDSSTGYIKEVLKTAGILLTICACSALLLASVKYITTPDEPVVEVSPEEQSILELFPNSTASEKVSGTYAAEVIAVYKVMEGNTVLGHSVNVGPTGYGGTINMMVAFDANGAVTGINIIKHKETRKLGDRALAPEYLGQFVGKTEALTAGQDIDLISGATVSSTAVLDGVNIAIATMAAGEGALN